MPSVNKTPNLGLNQWQGNEYAKRQDFVDDNTFIDAAIGNRIIDDSQVPTADNDTSLSKLLSWLGNMIKAITGKSSWRIAPVKSIEQLNNDLVTHEAENATAHGAVSAATANKIILRDANGRAKVAVPSASDDIARKDTVDVVQANLTTHVAVTASVSAKGHVQLGTTAGTAAEGNHGHTFSSITGTVPVAQGGTGQTTLALARNAMGLGNTTGALPIANGGTGSTTAATALTALGLTATAAELNKLDGVTATTTEINYIDGVTSNIQTQLNAKLGLSGGTISGEINFADNLLTRPYIKDYAEVLVTKAAATGTVVIDLQYGNVFKHTLAGAVTYMFGNAPLSGRAGSFTLILIQGDPAYAVTWSSSVKWVDDTIPDISTASKIYDFVFSTLDSGITWHGGMIGPYSA